MSGWKKVRIGEFLTERQERFKPDDKEIKKYQRLDKIDFRGTIHLSNKSTKTNMILVHPGDLVISGINVEKGAIAVYKGTESVTATIHYSSYTFNDSMVDLDYFKWFVKSSAFTETIKSQVKGGIKTEIKAATLLKLEITIPKTIEEQKQIVKKLVSKIEKIESTAAEIEKQKIYIRQLRQSVLQEAIEGKLTADWRKDHPVVKGNPDYDAEALFREIQEEKANQIANGEKKADSGKLSVISDEEKPFVIPDGWKWVRLGEISESSLGKMLDIHKNKGTATKYLRNLNVRWFSFDLSDLLEMKIQKSELDKYSAIKGDLLVCEGGYPGRSAIWTEDFSICFQKAVHRIRFYISKDINKLFNFYFFYLSESNELDKYITGAGIQHLTGKKMKTIVYPLPPLAEQAEIIHQVEIQLAKIDWLEQQIIDRETLVKQLMRGILKEAFEER
jgi:type I restriction enzyme S subunit